MAKKGDLASRSRPFILDTGAVQIQYDLCDTCIKNVTVSQVLRFGRVVATKGSAQGAQSIWCLDIEA